MTPFLSTVLTLERWDKRKREEEAEVKAGEVVEGKHREGEKGYTSIRLSDWVGLKEEVVTTIKRGPIVDINLQSRKKLVNKKISKLPFRGQG